MLQVYMSNRLEILVEHLAQELNGKASAPIVREAIVVQSKGMERWLSLNLARINGISAGIDYPFPNFLVEAIAKSMMPEFLPDPLFETEAMKFYVMQLLPECLERSEFEALRHYLTENPHDLKRYQLACRIASLYDQYLVFRPDMIMAWEAGHHQHWQAILWRRMIGKQNVYHKARLHQMIIENLRKPRVSTKGLPNRMFVFGVSYLPIYHMQIIEALAHHIPIRLYVLNPCQSYWGDIVSLQEETRQSIKYQEFTTEALHLEQGNPLLASMGGMGRAFFEILQDLEAEFIERFDVVRPTSHLTTIQQDILHLRNPIPNPKHVEKAATIRIHACHSPLREVEVLRDQLLDMFQTIPDLQPQEILVMMPEIETYAPYIRAVFDAQQTPSRRIPFSIADQSMRGTSRIVNGFLSLLDLKQTRFSAADVLAVLSIPGIKRKFGLFPEDVPIIERWIEQTRIRWGINASDREALGFPAYEENTWQRGISRSLLGYAMVGDRYRLFSGVLPLDEMEGHTAEVLGRFFTLLQHLFTLAQKLGRPCNAMEWVTLLQSTLETFFAEDDRYSNERHFIREAIQNLGRRLQLAGVKEPIAWEVIKAELDYQFTQPVGEFGFISHGVTFAAMLPMRSIPFKVICLLGMNHDAFPRDIRPPSFDLMAQKPRIGDRSRRNDDKYIFLEAILSAREIVYVSFLGRDIKDNSPMPPSVVVEELIDYLYTLDGIAKASRVVQHPLQPFAKIYFKTARKALSQRLFSFSTEYCQAARTQPHQAAPAPFIDKPLTEIPEEFRDLNLPTLRQFWQHPVRFFMQQRLGIFLEDVHRPDAERENFTLDGLDRYDLDQRLYTAYRNGINLQKYRLAARSQNLLPPGVGGDLLFDQASFATEEFARHVEEIIQESDSSIVEHTFEGSGFRLNARVAQIYPQGLIYPRLARMRPSILLATWLDHLVLCLQPSSEYAPSSLLICRDETWRLHPVSDAAKVLETLLSNFEKGLMTPLAFFPATSYTYAWQRCIKQQAEEQAVATARRKWQPNTFGPIAGESQDPYVLLGFRGVEDPLGEEFQQLSEAIWFPVLESVEQIETQPI